MASVDLCSLNQLFGLKAEKMKTEGEGRKEDEKGN
jgi:hypothetical protein